MRAEIGFIGLGQMGGPMAARLLADDVRLHVHDANPGAMAGFAARGAVAHGSARGVADAAAVVFACLPAQAISLAVAEEAAAGTALRVYAEMSTIGRETMAAVAATMAARGVAAVDAPVSGGPPGARAGTLAMMAAGAPEAVALVRPWLARIGRAVFVIGETPGMAQTMKLVNNLLIATNLASAFEALVMGAKAGLDPDLMLEVINASTGRSMVTETLIPKAVLPGSFDFGAATAIIAKDAELGVAEARSLGVPAWTVEQAARLWKLGVLEGYGRADMTEVIRLLEKWAGAEVRSRA
ncbi:MAG: NAD(P)-dependent oxidoreductase [Proteobacteria bacterium]|nr:NAD(P)-dependent oxidoreductase [Pseudomonadota bacterium]